MSHHFRQPWNPQRRERLVNLANFRQPIAEVEGKEAGEATSTPGELEDPVEITEATLPAE